MVTDVKISSRNIIAPIMAVMVAIGISASAAPPDLTKGELPGDTVTINLGPTGLRGWVHHVKADTSESRQIQVKQVYSGSPAAGKLSANDVILGADGSGADPVNFTADARKSLALAIAAAEARSPAELKLLRWSTGTTSTVTLTLRTMGAYSATAPYNCPKSATILEEGLQYIMDYESKGKYSFGTLSLLAGNNPADPSNAARMARAQTEARALIPSAATRAQLMSDARDATSMVTWSRGHTLIVLAEYYLVTRDSQVLPAIEAYAVNIARNQSLFGTTGHIFAEKNPDGSDNGPMGGVYGTVNSAGMPCFLGLLLARECGLTQPGFQSTTEAYVEAAIARSSRFFAYYAGKGAIPYGEHEPASSGHENNGKSGLAALAFALQDNRLDEGAFFAKMAAASGSERENGHTGAFFNYLWAPLGAAAGGEEAAASYFARTRWYYDLARRWDGGFDYDCLNGEGPNSGSTYNDFRMSTAMLLTYALPLRQLHLTGRSHDITRWLSSTDVAEAEVADNYDATSRTTNELITDLGSWSPKVQLLAAKGLATRTSETTALLPTLNALATDTDGNSRVGACQALGKIGHADSAPVLASLLTAPDNRVRFMAAQSMRDLPLSANMSVLDTILAAAASTATPLRPLDEEDPLHFAHAKLAMLLFYSGSAYGPKGILYNSVSGVDRNLLYPAIRAVAANPIGQARSTLKQTYKNLTDADIKALADTIVDSIHYRAPADKMFSHGIRQSGIELLQSKGIAEGVPLCRIFAENDSRFSVLADVLGVLGNYAGSSTTVVPDPEVIAYCQSLLTGSKAAEAQAVLDAIAADTAPTPLTPFKSIQSVTADATALTLPTNQTTLHVAATDHAKGDSIYTWRKLAGSGNVTFRPNGTGASKDATITFSDNVSDRYLLEVTMSDSRGFTEVSQTIIVTLANVDGTLPTDNDPPTPGTMTWSSPPQAVSDSAITMTAAYAIDFSGVQYSFTETSGNAGGTNSGWQDSPTYTDSGLTPGTQYTYTVTARDKSTAQNTTYPSAPASAMTAAADNAAPTPSPMSFAVAPYAAGATIITMRATTASDPSGVEYYFTSTTGGDNNSGWQTSPTYTATGLSPETQYTYKVMARDKSSAQNTTAQSSSASATTLAAPPLTGSTLTAGVQETFTTPLNVSVYTGKAKVYGTNADGVSGTSTVAFGSGTVLDYRFVKEGAAPDTLDDYAVGAGGLIDPYSLNATGINNLTHVNVWTTNDPDSPGANFPTQANLNGLNATDALTGSIDVSSLTSGTVYFLFGGFSRRDNNFDLIMKDTALVVSASEIKLDNVTAAWASSTTEYAVTSVNFTNDAGYDTIDFNMDATSGKFIGVVVTGAVSAIGNTPPTISTIDYQSLPSGTTTAALAFTVSDAETAAESLSVTGFSDNPTLVPDAGVVFGGSAGNRTVTVTPASGLTGTAFITVTVDDGSESVDETFLITVTDNFLSWTTANGVTGGPQGDANHNGVKNLVEYALADGDEHGVLSGNTLTFTKRGGDFGNDISYVIEISSDLGVDDPWVPAAGGVAENTSSISYTFTPGSPTRKFARLRVITAP